MASLHYINTPKLALLHPRDLCQSCLIKIGAAHHWPSSVWIGRKTINPLMSYIKPQITPPSPLIFAILNGGQNGGWIRRIWDHHVENPRKILAIWLGGWGVGRLGEVWFGSFSWTAYSFLMISPNLHDIWAMFFSIPSRYEKLVLLMLFRTSGDGYSL